MNNIVRNFLYKYKYILIFDFLAIFGYSIAIWIFGDTKIGDSDYSWGYVDIYLLGLYVIYPIFHGIISYITTKRILIPHIVLFIYVWIVFPIVSNISAGEFLRMFTRLSALFSEWLLLPSVVSVISLAFSFITCGIVKLVKLITLKPGSKKIN